MNTDAMFIHARKLPEKNNFQDDSHNWWAFWQNSDVNFSLEEEYVKILPENRNRLIELFANNLFDLAITLEDELEKLANNYKK